MRNFLISLMSFVGLTAFPTTHAMAQAAPEPGLTIAALRFSGTGCPMTDEVQTVALNISDDLLAFTGTLNRMLAEARRGEAASTACDVEIDFLAPDGVVAELRSLHLRGFSQLGEGQKAELVASYSLDGERSRTFRHDLSQAGQDYVFSDRVPVLLAEVCGGLHTLRVHLELNIAAADQATSALITLDSLDSDRIITRSFPIGECKR